MRAIVSLCLWLCHSRNQIHKYKNICVPKLTTAQHRPPRPTSHPEDPQTTSSAPGRLTSLFAENVSGCDLNSNSIKVTFILAGKQKAKGYPREHLENHLPQQPSADTAWLETTGREHWSASMCPSWKSSLKTV